MDQVGRNIGAGILLTGVTLLISWIVILIVGPLFGRWNWEAVAMVILAVEVFFLSLQALGRGSDPSLRRWDPRADPQVEFPLMGAKPGPQSIDSRYLWVVLPVSLAVAALLVTLSLS